MQPRHLVTALAAVAVVTVAVAPASAAKKHKPISGSKQITDTTPDPTASAPESGAGCDSLLPAQFPREAPVSIKIPAAGKLKVAINNQLDWAIEIFDSKGTSLGGSDGPNPNDVELTTVKIKKAGTYQMFACNLGGEPTVTMKWTWTPA